MSPAGRDASRPSLAGRVSLRPASAEDEPFLQRVYAATRAEEMALLPLEEEHRQELLRSQHRAQQAHYDAQFPEASFDVVLLDGVPAGRLYVARGEAEIRLIDIALLPEHRGAGVGRTLLEGLIAEADAARLPVTAHVERHNRALSLYRRLGFTPVAEGEVYLLIERRWP